jgi:hypothetical protein
MMQNRSEFNQKLADRLREERKLPTLPSNEMPVRRDSAGLRNALFDEIDALRRGDGDPQRAMAVAKLAQNILATAKMEYQIGKAGLPTRPVPILLGRDDPTKNNP